MPVEAVGIVGGTGDEGRGIALRLAQAGVEVRIGSRSSERAQQTARDLKGILSGGRISGHSNLELAERCDLIFLAVPFAHAETTLREIGPQLGPHHILVDVTVPVVFDQGPRMIDLPEGSGSETLRRFVPPETGMAATFKTLPAHLLGEIASPLDCDEFICADSPAVCARVLETLGRIAGLRWIDTGPLRYCRSLEAMTLLAIGLNRRHKSQAARFRVVGL